MQIVFDQGHIYEIDRIKDVCRRAADVGCISEDDIVGKVVLRLLPLNKLGTIYNPYDEQE